MLIGTVSSPSCPPDHCPPDSYLPHHPALSYPNHPSDRPQYLFILVASLQYHCDRPNSRQNFDYLRRRQDTLFSHVEYLIWYCPLFLSVYFFKLILSPGHFVGNRSKPAVVARLAQSSRMPRPRGHRIVRETLRGHLFFLFEIANNMSRLFLTRVFQIVRKISFY